MSTENWKLNVSFPVIALGTIYYFDHYKKSLELPYFSKFIRFCILILTHYDKLLNCTLKQQYSIKMNKKCIDFLTLMIFIGIRQ